MVDQEFSARNFRTIFELENRKGNFLEDRFFLDVFVITKKIQTAKFSVKQCRKTKEKLKARFVTAPSARLQTLIDRNEARLSRRYLTLKELKQEKATLLELAFGSLSEDVSHGIIDLELVKKSLPGLKDAYSLKDSPETFFPVKQVQRNLSLAFNCKQGDRKSILIQLHRCLDDRYEKLVLRTDIKEFYESISRSILLGQIGKSTRLGIVSKNVIFSILKNYSDLSGNENGIPRGVGVSASLAEIYMSSFDRYFENLPDVIFYARYVDDIVIVFDTKVALRGADAEYEKLAIRKLEELGLEINEKKTAVISYPNPTKNFDYLGYNFQKEGKKIKLELGAEKLEKYKKKIDKTFGIYQKNKAKNEKRARKDLILRLHYLCKNTHLVNNKRKAMIGVFFSNELLTSEKGLKKLDSHLTSNIHTISNATLRARLSRFSFLEGFRQRIYQKFSTKQLVRIVRAWKHGV